MRVCRAIQELHQFTADEIGIDSAARAEMERLLKNLQQLLVGISIMQVSLPPCGMALTAHPGVERFAVLRWLLKVTTSVGCANPLVSLWLH